MDRDWFDAGDCIGGYSTLRLRQFGNLDPNFCIRCTGRSTSYKMVTPDLQPPGRWHAAFIE